MPTYISMLTWGGAPQPLAGDVRAALEERSPFLRRRGMHSVAFLPDERDCAAVMVSSCADEDGPAQLAALIEPSADVRVESMLFEDDGPSHVHVPRPAPSSPPKEFAHRLLAALSTEG